MIGGVMIGGVKGGDGWLPVGEPGLEVVDCHAEAAGPRTAPPPVTAPA